MIMHHYYNNNHHLRPYTISLPVNPGALPARNAVAGDKPVVKAGFWPCRSGTVWKDEPDHRKRDDQQATDYWLPGDNWQTPARQMADIGPLPDGAMLERPEQSQEEKDALRLIEIDARLAEIDAESSPHTEIVADILSLATVEQRPPSDEERYLLDLHGAWIAEYRDERAALEAEAAALREERKGMGG